jgi:Ca-activated chloride channel family protein
VIHFEHIEYLWLLTGVAFMILLWWIMTWRSRRRLERWGDRKMFGRLIPDAKRWRPATKMALTLTGVALIVVALANPQIGTKIEKGKRSGSDIAFCLDVSNSMLAQDLQPNRLERAKRVVTNIMSEMSGDRVSLVVFAGQSFIQMPLTSDYSAVKLFLDQIDCSMISTQGTAIGDAIEKSMETFGWGDPDREWKNSSGRAIIVISDGENHEDDAISAAKHAAKEGVRVATIGMGLAEGAPIPDNSPRTRGLGYKRDREGNVIITKLNEQMLRDIAQAGNGVYIRADNSNNIKEITSMIEQLEKKDFEEASFTAYESRYHYPLIIGLCCLLAEVLIFERINRKWKIF